MNQYESYIKLSNKYSEKTDRKLTIPEFSDVLIKTLCEHLDIDSEKNSEHLRKELKAFYEGFYEAKEAMSLLRSPEKVKRDYTHHLNSIRHIKRALFNGGVDNNFLMSHYSPHSGEDVPNRLSQALEYIENFLTSSFSNIERDKPGPKQPFHQILVDSLCKIAKKFSSKNLGRIVDRTSGHESGPLFDFIAAVIPVIDPTFPINNHAGLGKRIRQALKK